jgi:hypothetical protein
MKHSIWYDEMKETHDEEYLGAFDNLRNNDWISGTGCSLSNKELKLIEKECMKDEMVFHSNGTLGTQRIFYFDKEKSKFVGFLHRPRMLGNTNVKMTYI